MGGVSVAERDSETAGNLGSPEADHIETDRWGRDHGFTALFRPQKTPKDRIWLADVLAGDPSSRQRPDFSFLAVQHSLVYS